MPEITRSSSKPKQMIVYILLPVCIGLAVAGYLFWQDFDPRLFSGISFSAKTVLFVGIAVLFMFGRDLGLTWRYRKLSDKKLNWWQSIRVNILCEFTSAVTPSAVGGSSLIVLFLNREGIDAGRSTALMFSCLFLDELFFVISVPIILFSIPFSDLFGETTILTQGVKNLFFLVYVLIFIWTLLLYIGLFKRPEWVRNFLNAIFRNRILKRWSKPVSELGDNIVSSSKEIGKKPFSFWAAVFGATSFSWISRYLVVNALLIAFSPIAGDHLLAFARQFILWVIMIVSPTPGGSGLSEYMFSKYYADFFPIASMALVVALIWRIITYYFYLAVGICVVPGWLKKR